MTRYFSYKFIAFLTFLSIIFTNVDAISALPPIWLGVAKQKCTNNDEKCIENIRDSFIKELDEFIKENPNKNYTDFAIKKCIEYKVFSSPEQCVDSYTRNYLFNKDSNENPDKSLTDSAIRNCLEFKVFSTREQCVDWEKQRFIRR